MRFRIITNNECNFSVHYILYYFSIYWYAAVSLNDQFAIFGGTHEGTRPLDGIFGFKNGRWSKLGTLNQARYQHSAISNGKEIMIVGGLGKLKTEVWNIEFSHNRTIEPELSGYHFYPELCLVPYDFLAHNRTIEPEL